MENLNARVVERYLSGLKNKNLSQVPFAPDVSFESPLTPKLTGKERVVECLTGLFPAIKDIRIKQHIVEGEYVATVFDFDSTFGVIPVFDCFRISNGLLKEIRPYYDPRPITNAVPSDRSLEETLIAEERQKWELWKQKDVDKVEGLYADDFLEVDVSGRGVVAKAQAFQEVRDSDLVIHGFSLSDFRVLRPSQDTAIVIYKATGSFSMKGQEFPNVIIYASSAWANRGGKWLTVYYQATPGRVAP